MVSNNTQESSGGVTFVLIFWGTRFSHCPWISYINEVLHPATNFQSWCRNVHPYGRWNTSKAKLAIEGIQWAENKSVWSRDAYRTMPQTSSLQTPIPRLMVRAASYGYVAPICRPPSYQTPSIPSANGPLPHCVSYHWAAGSRRGHPSIRRLWWGGRFWPWPAEKGTPRGPVALTGIVREMACKGARRQNHER